VTNIVVDENVTKMYCSDLRYSQLAKSCEHDNRFLVSITGVSEAITYQLIIVYFAPCTTSYTIRRKQLLFKLNLA
jgi:hypothetical protein